MTMSCPGPGTLSAYRAGLLASPEAFESHAAGCPRCRQALRLLGEPLPQAPLGGADRRRLIALAGPRRSRTPWVLSAAALILLAVGIKVIPDREALAPGRDPSREALRVPEAWREETVDARDASEGRLAQGASLLLARGARVSLEAGGRGIRPESGCLWLEAWGEGGRQVSLPGGTLRLARGLLALRVSPAPARTAGFCREALADGPEPRIEAVLLEGEARFLAGEDSLPLGAGSALRRDGDAWTTGPAAAAAQEDFKASRIRAVQALPGLALVPPGTRLDVSAMSFRSEEPARGAFRWTTVISHRTRTTELGFVMPVDGTWRRWTAGLAGAEPGSRECVELTWDGRWLRGRVDGRLRFEMEGALAREALRASASRGWGLEVWGGELVVERSVLEGGR